MELRIGLGLVPDEVASKSTASPRALACQTLLQQLSICVALQSGIHSRCVSVSFINSVHVSGAMSHEAPIYNLRPEHVLQNMSVYSGLEF